MWADSPWLTIYEPRPEARVRLICLPHAGSSAAAYAHWAGRLPDDIEVCAVEYPGHGSRRAEQCLVRLHALAAAILNGVLPIPAPFAIFGHSMGALIGFEIVRHLRRLGEAGPVALFIAGCRGPSLPPRKPPLSALPEAELIAELRSLNGTPEEMLANPEFVRLFLPALRADFEMTDTYTHHDGVAPDCRMFAYGGADDAETRPDELRAWARETRGALVVRLYPGDHFFLRQAEVSVLDDLARDLREIVPREGAHVC